MCGCNFQVFCKLRVWSDYLCFSQACCAEMLVQMDSAFLSIYLMKLMPKIFTRKKITALAPCKFLFRYCPGSLQVPFQILPLYIDCELCRQKPHGLYNAWISIAMASHWHWLNRLGYIETLVDQAGHWCNYSIFFENVWSSQTLYPLKTLVCISRHFVPYKPKDVI